MASIVHLSDLHLAQTPGAQRTLFDALVAALRAHRAARDRPVDLLAITGDVFDSATLDPAVAIPRFASLLTRVQAALGPGTATVVLPGNHDRRRDGVLGPHREGLFLALRDALAGRAWVHGCATPFLATLLPAAFHGLPAHVVAYDSTHLPRGLVGAGGVVRQEDLLQVAAAISREHPGDDRPLVLLLHHHLIPTPLTDVVAIETHDRPRPLRWLLGRALPLLVAHGDREELTMTALGAGTALSTLHAFGRAVLVLHGHKHYPTARLLRATVARDGDLLIASAGSGGTTQTWHLGNHPDAPRLWPSFNAIELDAAGVAVASVSFSDRDPARPVATRALARARRADARWEIDPIAEAPSDRGPRFALNEAAYALEPNAEQPAMHWDVTCRRTVMGTGGAARETYVEFVSGLRGARVTDVVRGGVARPSRTVPCRLGLASDGVTSYRLRGGVARTLEAAARDGPEDSAFEWVALLNRYRSDVARLALRHPRGLVPFGSVTDLTSGRERPAPIASDGERAVLEARDCPARTLLRIYWPLERP